MQLVLNFYFLNALTYLIKNTQPGVV